MKCLTSASLLRCGSLRCTYIASEGVLERTSHSQFATCPPLTYCRFGPCCCGFPSDETKLEDAVVFCLAVRLAWLVGKSRPKFEVAFWNV